MLLAFVLFCVLNESFAKVAKEMKTSFVGEKIFLKCSSSFVPIWEWHGKNLKDNLAIGVDKRENFKNDR